MHAFLFRLDRDERQLALVRREVANALSLPTWNPAHFLDAAELLLGFALAHRWLRGRWTAEEDEAMRRAMVERAILPGLEIHETRRGPSAFFPDATHNWNGVGNAALIAGAFAVAGQEPALASRVLAAASRSLRRAFEAFAPDGASEEGPSYWSYGVNFLCIACDLLEGTEHAMPGELHAGGLARSALYRLHIEAPSQNFDYADCWPVSGPEFGYAWLARRFGPAQARRHLRALVAAGHAEEGLIPGGRLAPLLVLALPAPETADEAGRDAPERAPCSALFRGVASIYVARSSWVDAEAAWFGFKAGDNHANHGHLDLGSFVFEAGGRRWARDFGPDSYSLPGYFKKTFPSPCRWDYLRNLNHAHNTLVIGGELQSLDARADIVAHGEGWAVADLASAHPGRVSSWRRGARLLGRRGLVVRDELAGLAAGVELRWLLHTDARVSLAADGRGAAELGGGATGRRGGGAERRGHARGAGLARRGGGGGVRGAARTGGPGRRGRRGRRVGRVGQRGSKRGGGRAAGGLALSSGARRLSAAAARWGRRATRRARGGSW